MHSLLNSCVSLVGNSLGVVDLSLALTGPPLALPIRRRASKVFAPAKNATTLHARVPKIRRDPTSASCIMHYDLYFKVEPLFSEDKA